MSAHLIDRSFHDFVPVRPAKQGDLQGDTLADDDLRHRIICFLRTRGVPEAEALEVEVKGGMVTVRGRLSSRHAKWLCLECCSHVAGVITLIDKLGVEACLQKVASQDTALQINDNATVAPPKNLVDR